MKKRAEDTTVVVVVRANAVRDILRMLVLCVSFTARLRMGEPRHFSYGHSPLTAI